LEFGPHNGDTAERKTLRRLTNLGENMIFCNGVQFCIEEKERKGLTFLLKEGIARAAKSVGRSEWMYNIHGI
jgi:hypothetical protein